MVNLIFIVFLATLFSATLSLHDDDDDPENPQLKLPVDKSNWVDYGDMFTYDPITKTNREPVKTDHKNFKCDCPATNDHCGKTSYQVIRRLLILLNKQIIKSYSSGSILELKLYLDDVFFVIPENLNNASDCNYLAYLHDIVDQILTSVVVHHPEPYNRGMLKYLTLKTCVVVLVALLTAIGLLRMDWKIRLFAFFIFFIFIVLIWEYLLLYKTEMAKVEEISKRLKDKCESQAKSSWFGFLSNIIPDFTFGNEISECTGYYISSRVDPLLAVNPIMVFSKIYERTILFAMQLTVNATGAAIKAFFSHIPTIWIPFFIAAGVIVTVFYLKYVFKYSKKTKKSKTSKQKKGVREASQRRSDQKLKKLPVQFPIARYGSTGNIQKLV